jgi:hypothetical protein
MVGGRPARVLRTRVLDPAAPPVSDPSITVERGRLLARCGGGGKLAILELEVDGLALPATDFAARYGAEGVSLGR